MRDLYMVKGIPKKNAQYKAFKEILSELLVKKTITPPDFTQFLMDHH